MACLIPLLETNFLPFKVLSNFRELPNDQEIGVHERGICELMMVMIVMLVQRLTWIIVKFPTYLKVTTQVLKSYGEYSKQLRDALTNLSAEVPNKM